MKVLIWTGNHGDVIVAAREPEEAARAWLYLFKLMDEMGYYHDLDAEEKDAHDKSKAGNAYAARWLLSIRSDHQYEQVRVEMITVP
jgi:hypothetical protein